MTRVPGSGAGFLLWAQIGSLRPHPKVSESVLGPRSGDRCQDLVVGFEEVVSKIGTRRVSVWAGAKSEFRSQELTGVTLLSEEL